MTAGEQERSEVTDPYTMWDGPYVLGALDPDERHEFELHLAECDDCRAAVAELAGLPGLLARVAVPDIFDELIAEVGEDSDFGFPPLPESLRTPPQTLLAAIPAAVPQTEVPQAVLPQVPVPGNVIGIHTARSRRREWALRGASAAAAAAVAVGLTIGLHSTSTTPGPQVVAARAMEPVVATPITADFQLVDVGNGNTRVDLTCRYGEGPGTVSYSGWFGMWVTTKSGTSLALAWWPVKPGETVKADPIVNVAADQIRSVDIRTKDSSQVLLSGTI